MNAVLENNKSMSFAEKITSWVGSYLSVTYARAGKVDEIRAKVEHKRKQVSTWTAELRKSCFTWICLACPTSHLLTSRTRASPYTYNHSHRITHSSLQCLTVAPYWSQYCFVPHAPTPQYPHLPIYLFSTYLSGLTGWARDNTSKREGYRHTDCPC